MSKVFVIAEAGVNHNGDLRLAKKMIDVAGECSADAIKFQTFKAERAISRFAAKADYQKKTTGDLESQVAMVKKLELSDDAFEMLCAYCRDKGIMFLSSPFDMESIEFLDRLGLNAFKIPSGEITNLPYLRKIGRLNKRVILSTGMADLGEVEDALDVLTTSGTLRSKIALLHCNTEYPTPHQDVNLRAMLTIANAFQLEVGYSDHTIGIEVPIAAVALGATIIEKHFTLSRTMDGPDHQSSLEPEELKRMVASIRITEAALGNGLKAPSKSEQKNIVVARKSIVAGKTIKTGDVFSEENITVKRPGTGINPMEWDCVIGRTSPRAFEPDELIVL